MKLYLAIMSIVFGLMGIVSVVPAMFSVMMFDAPGSSDNPATVGLFLAAASLPIVCVAAIIRAWTLYRSGRSRLARIVILAPIVNLVVGAIANYCLTVFYDGRFNG